MALQLMRWFRAEPSGDESDEMIYYTITGVPAPFQCAIEYAGIIDAQKKWRLIWYTSAESKLTRISAANGLYDSPDDAFQAAREIIAQIGDDSNS